MAKSRFVAPDISNATPMMLLDEMGKLSAMEGQIKKMRAFYKTAYYSRMNISLEDMMYEDKPFPEEGVTKMGETFIATTVASHPRRVSTTLLKEKYPDIAEEVTVEGSQLTTRFTLAPGVVNPSVEALLKELELEMDLD